MTLNMSNNYCCVGGGGFLHSGYVDARRAYGKLKAERMISKNIRKAGNIEIINRLKSHAQDKFDIYREEVEHNPQV
jgi:hypothetical protein